MYIFTHALPLSAWDSMYYPEFIHKIGVGKQPGNGRPCKISWAPLYKTLHPDNATAPTVKQFGQTSFDRRPRPASRDIRCPEWRQKSLWRHKANGISTWVTATGQTWIGCIVSGFLHIKNTDMKWEKDVCLSVIRWKITIKKETGLTRETKNKRITTFILISSINKKTRRHAPRSTYGSKTCYLKST